MHILLYPPNTTFVLQFNENPSASRAAVRAVVRAAVRSRASPALSSQYYICTTIQRNPSASCRRTRRRTRRRPLSRPSGSVLPVLHLYYNSTKIPQLPAAVCAVIRDAVRYRAPPALSSQYYICITTQRKSLSFLRRHTCRGMRNSPLSRPSGSVLPLLLVY